MMVLCHTIQIPPGGEPAVGEQRFVYYYYYYDYL